MATGPATGGLASATVTGAGHGRLVWILGSLSAFAPLSIDMYLPALPSMARGLGTSASVAQLSLTACLAGLAVGQLLAGPLSDALGRRRPLLAGVATYAVASALCVAAPDIWALLAMRLLQGLAGAAGIVIARAMVRDLYEGNELARFFALLLMVNGTAPIAAPIIGAQLLRFTSWRGVFAVLAGIGVVLLVVTAGWLPETLPAARRHRGGGRALLRDGGRLIADRQFIGYALASGLAFGAMFAYISGSPFVLQAMFGISPQLFSLIFAINGAGIICAGLLSRRLVGRRSPRELLTVGLTGSATGGILLLAAAVLAIGLPLILPALFVMVASVGFILPNATALALSRYGGQAGSASAVIGLAQFAIGAAAAPLVGIAGPHTDLPMAVVISVLGISARLSRPRTRSPLGGESPDTAGGLSS
ncbi:MAG: multidrug effflux MFS transporter [Streptosporangiaceae bacterium]|jgi:DHA1 family bicyclomycin/chloramphenicol resistance-like MFS transporter